MKKLCLNCNEDKEQEEFYPCKNSNDGYGTVCRKCTSEQGKEYRHSLVGLARKTYHNQVVASKRRGHISPNYTEEEFIIWMIRQDSFPELYKNWVESGYDTKLKPSGDRLDDYQPYTFDNLRLVTWGENEQKLRDDVRNGVNTKKSKGCIQFSLDGELIAEFHSLRDAARATNSDSAGISSCCNNKQFKHNNFIWKYKVVA